MIYLNIPVARNAPETSHSSRLMSEVMHGERSMGTKLSEEIEMLIDRIWDEHPEARSTIYEIVDQSPTLFLSTINWPWEDDEDDIPGHKG